MNYRGKKRRASISDAYSIHSSSSGLDTRTDHKRNVPVKASAVTGNPLKVRIKTTRDAWSRYGMWRDRTDRPTTASAGNTNRVMYAVNAWLTAIVATRMKAATCVAAANRK